MASADDAGGYDCARPVGVVAGAGQVGAVGLVGPDERGGAQDCHLDGGGEDSPGVVWPCPCFLVVDFPAVEGSGILRFGSGHADAEGVELLFVADDDPVTCPGVQVGMPGSHRYEVGGDEVAWGEVARHDHAGQVVAGGSVVIGVQVYCGLRWVLGCSVDMDSVQGVLLSQGSRRCHE